MKIFLSLFLFTLISRLPYFFQTDIDWDESSFILLGQSVLNGHLPYTDLLDVKPPLLWYCFATLIMLAGKSFVFIRFFGSILVTIVAYLNYLIAKKIWHHHVGLISACLLIVSMNFVSSGQAIMSEHFSLLPLMVAFALILWRSPNFWTIYFAGFFLGIASFIRFNLLYVVLLVGIFLCLETYKSYSELFKRAIAYSLGFGSVLTLIVLPYFFTGKLEALYLGLIKASLSYSGQGNIWDVISYQFVPLLILGITLFLALYPKAIATIQKTANSKFIAKRFQLVFILFLVSIEISILRSGVFYDHYSIQFLPVLSLFYAPLIEQIYLKQKSFISSIIRFTLILIFSAYLLLQYIPLTTRYFEKQTLMDGDSFLAAEYLKQSNPQQEPVWLTKNQLAYWLTGLDPITPSVAHPSNINKIFLLKAWYGEDASVLNEVKKILAKNPLFIIIQDPNHYFGDDAEAQSLLTKTLNEKYLNVDNIRGKQLVYKRKNTDSL